MRPAHTRRELTSHSLMLLYDQRRRGNLQCRVHFFTLKVKLAKVKERASSLFTQTQHNLLFRKISPKITTKCPCSKCLFAPDTSWKRTKLRPTQLSSSSTAKLHSLSLYCRRWQKLLNGGTEKMLHFSLFFFSFSFSVQLQFVCPGFNWRRSLTLKFLFSLPFSPSLSLAFQDRFNFHQKLLLFSSFLLPFLFNIPLFSLSLSLFSLFSSATKFELAFSVDWTVKTQSTD